jgi:hypothetical protein
MTPRSIASPTNPGDQERRGDRQQQRDTRMHVRQPLLQQVGRVRPEHDEFAMRHVDHAHDAEGDRQSHGRQQQHGAEADRRTAIRRALPRPGAAPPPRAAVRRDRAAPRAGPRVPRRRAAPYARCHGCCDAAFRDRARRLRRRYWRDPQAPDPRQSRRAAPPPVRRLPAPPAQPEGLGVVVAAVDRGGPVAIRSLEPSR